MMHRRSGYTLAEMLVVIVLTSTIMGTMTVTLFSLNRADQRVRDDLTQQIQLQRMIQTLRSDVHQAVEMELERSRDSLALSMRDGLQIRFQLEGECLQREVKQDGRTIARDEFWLPPCTARWQIDRSQVAPKAVLTLSRIEPAKGGAVFEEVPIVAACLSKSHSRKSTP